MSESVEELVKEKELSVPLPFWCEGNGVYCYLPNIVWTKARVTLLDPLVITADCV
jgi:hypothetical protein